MSIQIDKRTLEIAVKLDPDARHLQQLKDNLSEANREMDKLKDEKKSLHKPKKKDTQAWEDNRFRPNNDAQQWQRARKKLLICTFIWSFLSLFRYFCVI